MTESVSRPSLLRLRSQVPGSFNTEDELSPIKTSFDFDETHQILLHNSSSPGVPLFSNDSSLRLPEHDDMSGASFEGRATDDSNEKAIVMDEDSNFSMIASSTVSQVHSGGDAQLVHTTPPSKRHASSYVAGDSPLSVETQKKHDRDLNDASVSTPPISRVLQSSPPNHLASSSPTLSSKLSTQSTQPPVDTTDREQAHSSTHSQTSIARTTTFHTYQSRSESWNDSSHFPSTSPSQYQTPAAPRSTSRVPSVASLGGYETAEEQGTSPSLNTAQATTQEDPSTPKLSHLLRHTSSVTPTPTKAILQPSSEDSQTQSAMLGHGEDELDRILRNFVPVTPCPLPPEYYEYSDSEDSLPHFSDELEPRKWDTDGNPVDWTPQRIPKQPKAEEQSESDAFLAIAQGAPTPTNTVAGPSKKANGKRLRAKDYHPKGNALPSNRLSIRDQNTAIDRLMKDNFDLRMKTTYLQRLVDQMDNEEVKKIVKQNSELLSENIQSAKAARELKRSIRDLEAKLKTSETETNRLKLEHKTTIIQNRTRITELETELVETQKEVKQLHRRSADARSRSNSQKEAMVKHLTEVNGELLREVKAQTSMLTSRNRERDLLTQQIEELKLRNRDREQLSQQLEDLKAGLRTHKRSSSHGSSVSKSERDHYEDRIGTLRDEMAVLRLADLSAAKKLQAQRKECDELHAIANHLDDVLVKKGDHIENLNETIKALEKEAEKLRNEVRMLDNGIAHIEADCQTKVRRIEELEAENEDMSHELESIEKALVEANGKNQKLSVELESRQGECAFLREEQDGTMLKIGALEAALKTTETSLTNEKHRASDIEGRLSDLEDSLRKTIDNPTADRATIITTITTLRHELDTSTTQLTQTRQTLSKQEQDSKATIQQLESTLLSEQNHATDLASRITELQKVLDKTIHESEKIRTTLSETEHLLNHRSALLETHGLETRQLTDLVEKERQGRRQDKAQYEQWQRSHQHTSRTVTQKDMRINELEAARSSDRKKLAALEQQFKDQLSERNQLLLALWHRLSTVCGTDWQHQNSLVNGHLPTFEVVNNMLPAFSKNLLLSVKTIENIVGGFKARLRGMEQAFARDFEALERNLEMRSRRLERLEAQVLASRATNASRLPNTPPVRMSSRAETSAMLARHYSTTAIETIDRQNEQKASNAVATSQPHEPSQQRWVHRLRELERRLKAEREARLQDRSGARKRLEEGRAENEALRLELEREKVRNGE